MKKLLVLTTMFALFATPIYTQENIDSVKSNPGIKLETRKEKKAYRNQLMAEFQNKLGKHFNVPCSKCWYFTARGGYGVPFLTLRNEAPFDFLGTSNYQFQGNGQISDKVLYGTAGQGYRFGIGVGKMFNTFIGFEFFLNYNKYTGETLGNIEDRYYSSNLLAKAFDFSVMPQLVLQSPNLNNIYLYSKVGAILPFYGYADIEVEVDDREGRLISVLFQDEPLGPIITLLEDLGVLKQILANSGVISEALGYRATISAKTKAEFIGDDLWETLRTIVGFTAVAGMKYQISPIVSVSAELRYTGFHVSLTSNRVQSLDGEFNILGQTIKLNKDDLPFGTFNFDYVPELTHESNNPNYNPRGFDPDKAREELPYRTSTSVLSGNIGLQVNIPTKKQRAEVKGIEFVSRKEYRKTIREKRKSVAEKTVNERKKNRADRRMKNGVKVRERKEPKEKREKQKE